MTRFLAVIRRLFLAITFSLILSLVLFRVKFSDMLSWAIAHDSVRGFFSIVFLISPILFLVLSIVSVIYIRHHGQFAYVHQTQSPVTSFFRCLGHDLVSPFKNIKNFFAALFNKNAMGRSIFILRFIELVVIILLCVAGIVALIQWFSKESKNALEGKEKHDIIGVDTTDFIQNFPK